MSVISSQNRRTLIAVFVTLFIACEMIAYVATTPRPRDQFFQLYVLGTKHMAADYYPDNNTDIHIGEPVTWYLGVTDNMGMVELISMRVKLGNQTIESPDDNRTLESPASFVTEFRRFLQDNETWEIPFVWSISDAVSIEGSTHISELEINNETYPIRDCSAANGHNFRLIIELWTWQTEGNAFQFGWIANGEHRVAWLQLWFDITTPKASLADNLDVVSSKYARAEGGPPLTFRLPANLLWIGLPEGIHSFQDSFRMYCLARPNEYETLPLLYQVVSS
jgi:hypothetical protein